MSEFHQGIEGIPKDRDVLVKVKRNGNRVAWAITRVVPSFLNTDRVFTCGASFGHFLCHEDDIIGWMELPEVPNAS